MASDDVRETIFIHFNDYHTKAVQLRGQYLREYFPPAVRMPGRINRRMLATFVVTLVGIGMSASFFSKPPRAVSASSVAPAEMTIDSDLSVSEVRATY